MDTCTYIQACMHPQCTAWFLLDNIEGEQSNNYIRGRCIQTDHEMQEKPSITKAMLKIKRINFPRTYFLRSGHILSKEENRNLLKNFKGDLKVENIYHAID